MVVDLFETAVCRCSTLFGNQSCNVNLVNSLFVFLKTCSETIRATGCSGQQFEHITLPSPLEICYYHFAVWGSKNCIYCPNFEVFQVPLHQLLNSHLLYLCCCCTFLNTNSRMTCRMGQVLRTVDNHTFGRLSMCETIPNPLQTHQGIQFVYGHVVMSPNVALVIESHCVLDVFWVQPHLYLQLCAWNRITQTSCWCENRAKENLQAVLSSDNIITLTVSLCLIEIFSGADRGNSYLCRLVYRSHSCRYSSSSGCLSGPGTEGVIMIRIISFRGTAAKVVISYSSITGGVRIPFYSSL